MKPRRPTILYPLGKNTFASIKTHKVEAKIQIRHYVMATNIKGGRDVPTQKRVSLGLKEFQRLLKIQKNLAQDYNQQMSSLFILQETVTYPWSQREKRKETDTESHIQVSQSLDTHTHKKLYKRRINRIDMSTFSTTPTPTAPSLATNTSMKKTPKQPQRVKTYPLPTGTQHILCTKRNAYF